MKVMRSRKLSAWLLILILVTMISPQVMGMETQSSNKQIYMFVGIIPNTKNVGFDKVTSYSDILEGRAVTLPSQASTIVLNTTAGSTTTEMLAVTWSIKSHHDKDGNAVDMDNPTFSEGDKLVFKADCNVYPYMSEEHTAKPEYTILLSKNDATFIKQFSVDEIELERQNILIPTYSGDEASLTMPSSVAFRMENQNAGSSSDYTINMTTSKENPKTKPTSEVINSFWRLKEAPESYVIPDGETAKDFTADHPVGDYIYELTIDPAIYAEKAVFLYHYASPHLFSSSVIFSNYAFAENANRTDLPVRKVVHVGKGESNPTYTIKSFEPFAPEITNQTIAKGASVKSTSADADKNGDLRFPHSLIAKVENSVTKEEETIHIPILWESKTGSPTLDRNTIGHYTYVPGWDGGQGVLPTTHKGFILDQNGVSLPNITIEVGEISIIKAGLELPATKFYKQQPIKVDDMKPIIPVEFVYDAKSSKPYTDAFANLKLVSYTNASGETTNVSDSGSFFIKEKGEYTFNYEPEEIIAKQEQYNEALDGWRSQNIRIENLDCKFTQKVSISDPIYTDGEVVRFVDSKYNTPEGHKEFYTLEKDDPLTQIIDPLYNTKALETITYVENQFASGGSYESVSITKDIEWVLQRPISIMNARADEVFDPSTFDTTKAGIYTYVARFKDGSVSKNIVMPKFTITIFDITADKIQPKYGDGTQGNPYIYYVNVNETKVLVDPTGNQIDFDGIYKKSPDDVLYHDGEENTKPIKTPDGKVLAVTGKSIGSDPYIVGTNNAITTHAWVYVLDSAQAPKQTIAESGGWSTDPTYPMPKHSIHVDKSAAWTAPGEDTAYITFDIIGKEVAIPRNADVILTFDNSGSMVDQGHWGSVSPALEEFGRILFDEANSNPHNTRMAVTCFGDDSTHSFNFVNNFQDYNNNIKQITQPSGGVRTGYTSGLAHATAYAETRVGEDKYRPLYVFFFTDGDMEEYFTGQTGYTTNYKATNERNMGILNDYKSIRQAITVDENNQFLEDFSTAPVDVYTPGQGLDKYYDYVYKILSDSEDTVITDVINENYEVIEDALPENAELTTDDKGIQTVKLNIGRVNPRETKTEKIKIKLKDSSKPTGFEKVTYPTNKTAKATYKNFLYTEHSLDDTEATAEEDRIQKPELSYPGFDRYQVEFHGNGATSGKMDIQIYQQGVSQHLTKNAFERTGYVFLGWDNHISGDTVECDDEANIQLPSQKFPVKDGETLHLYAVWKAGEATAYTVIHQLEDLTGGTYTTKDTQNLTGITDTEVTPPVNTYVGFTSPDTQTAKILGDGSLVITYQYDRIRHTVSFDSKGGTVTPDSQTVLHGGLATQPTGNQVPTKTGYTFDGWYTSSDGGKTLSGSRYNFGTEVTGDMVLYAKWVDNTTILPQTGDNANMMMWTMISSISLVALAVVGLKLKSKKQR